MDDATETLLRDLEASPTDLKKLVVTSLGRSARTLAIASAAIARWQRDDPHQWAAVREWLLARDSKIVIVKTIAHHGRAVSRLSVGSCRWLERSHC